MQKEAHPIDVRQSGPRPPVGEFGPPPGHFWARTKASSRQTQPCLLLSLFSGHGRPRLPTFPRDGLHGWPALWVRKKPGRGLPLRPPTRLGQEGGALGAHILGFPASRWKRHRAQVTASTFCSVSVVSMDSMDSMDLLAIFARTGWPPLVLATLAVVLSKLSSVGIA